MDPLQQLLKSAAMDLQLWHILILAVVQGIAEFLPISSSGHVVVIAALLGGGQTEAFDVGDVNIVLHVGTLFAILAFYGRRILGLLRYDHRTIRLLAVGTVPGVVLGLTIKKLVPGMLESPQLAGMMLITTGLVLVWAARQPRGQGTYPALADRHALWIGLSQAAAILPGLSRSGATISTGIRLGLAPADAATFSFLLAVPIIAGGGLYEGLSMIRGGEVGGTPPGHLLLGGAVSFLVGLISLWWLIRWIEKGRLEWFAWWCIPVGVAVLLWQWML